MAADHCAESVLAVYWACDYVAVCVASDWVLCVVGDAAKVCGGGAFEG